MWKIMIAVGMSLLAALSCQAGTLPDLAGATVRAETATRLETTSGDRGLWCSRTYLFPGGRELHVEYLAGEGPGVWTPPVVREGSEGPIGSGGVCRSLSVAGYAALLEEHPLLGRSLAVSLGEAGTLTLESSRLDADALVRMAEELMRGMQK